MVIISTSVVVQNVNIFSLNLQFVGYITYEARISDLQIQSEAYHSKGSAADG